MVIIPSSLMFHPYDLCHPLNKLKCFGQFKLDHCGQAHILVWRLRSIRLDFPTIDLLSSMPIIILILSSTLICQIYPSTISRDS